MAINQSLNQKNVAFLSGTSQNLDRFFDSSNSTYYGKAKEGTFYLTEDTHQLYIGQKDSGSTHVFPVLVNSGVVTVNDVKDLDPVAGSICYVSQGNMLCYYDDTVDPQTGRVVGWQQVNPDTDTNIVSDKLTLGKTVNSSNHTITISASLTEKDGTSGTQLDANPDLTSSITLTSEDIGAITTDVAVGVGAALSNGVATISTKGTGSDSASNFTITQGDNVEFSGNANALTIAAKDTTYTLGISEDVDNQIDLLSNDGGADGGIEFAAGQNMTVSVVDNSENPPKVTYGHSTISTSQPAATAGTIGQDRKFTTITGVTVNNGHVTNVAKQTFTIPETTDTTYTITDLAAGNDGKISGSLTESDGTKHLFTTDSADLYYKVGSTTVLNQADLADYFYTETEIDNKFKGLNALEYVGTISNGSLPSGNIKAGYTYLVTNQQVQYGSATEIADEGDLLIATGSEGDNGYIPTANLVWTHVPSGDEIDTTYSLGLSSEQSGASITLAASTDDGADPQSITILAGTGLNSSVENDTLTVSHASVNTNNPTEGTVTQFSGEYGNQFTAVTGVTVDNGHITNVTKSKFTLPTAPEVTHSLSSSANATTVELYDPDSGNAGSVEFKAGTGLVIDGAAADEITFSHANVGSAQNFTGNNQTSLAHEGTFKAITGLTTNAQGHVTSVTQQTLTLPAEEDYTCTLVDSYTRNGSTGAITLSGVLGQGTGGTEAGSMEFVLKSSTLTTALNNDNEISLDLVWGSF